MEKTLLEAKRYFFDMHPESEGGDEYRVNIRKNGIRGKKHGREYDSGGLNETEETWYRGNE